MAAVQKITLKDEGQDFTDWYVRDGIVIDCQPHQGKVWVGTRLEYPEGELVAGSTFHFRGHISSSLTFLNYPVETIEVLDEAEALKVVGYGHRWAEMKGIGPSALGL